MLGEKRSDACVSIHLVQDTQKKAVRQKTLQARRVCSWRQRLVCQFKMRYKKGWQTIHQKAWACFCCWHVGKTQCVQYLLHSQYGLPGFQATTLGYHLTFDIMRNGFIQILHNGEDNWFTISTLGLPSGYVHIYDSLYNTCTDHGIEQTSSILSTPNSAVQLHFMDVDKQTNHTNCGLYAIAYAIDLCCDEDVCYRKYDAVLMCQHLSKCLESRRLTAFPGSDRPSSHVIAKRSINVRCYCRMPNAGLIIQCNSCKEWFHDKYDISIPKKPGMIKNTNGIVKTVSPSTEPKTLIYISCM